MENIIQKLIGKIQTKALKNLDEKIILSKIDELLRKDAKLANKINSFTEKSSEFKNIVKKIKKEMHYSYGSFQKDVSKREKLFEKLKYADPDSSEFLELHKKIMLTHSSTKERIKLYDFLYKDLFSMTGKPFSMLDLGSGLNPFSVPWMHLPELSYIASEFSEKDNKFIERYFEILSKKYPNYELRTMVLDLENDFILLKQIKVDIVFAWKIFDIISSKSVENIINHLNAKYLVASFSTKTLGRKQMTSPRRAGFQKMLRRLDLKFQTKTYENEIFYIIQLQK